MTKKRPELPGLLKPNITVVEEFQNSVIRPIIKMQHTLIVALFKLNLEKRKTNFSSLTPEKKNSVIATSLQKDISFKKMLLGSIIGHFTLEEFNLFKKNEAEYNRRIITIVTKRLQDSVLEL